MINMRVTVKMEHQLQDGGALEYVYHNRTAWHCVVFVGKRYGSKGCGQSISGGYSVDGDPPVSSDDVFHVLQHCRRGDLHRPTGSMFVFYTCLPFQELLHPIMGCFT
jgi:hypothetical protein